MSRSLATLPSLLLLGTALSFPALAFAQDTSAGKVEEVVVTASRRSQTVQEVPYNISAYSGAALEESGVVDFSNLSHFVPGLAFVDTGPAIMGNNNNFILRGLNANQTINGGGNPNAAVAPVSTYLGESIAVPHGTIAAKEHVKRTGIVICQYPAGVAFGESADEVARLVIGIAARNDEHIQVITRLTNALDEPGLVDRLASTQDPQEFLDLLGAEQAA